MDASLLEIINDDIFIGDSLADLQTEIGENFCVISRSLADNVNLTLEDLLEFYSQLIAKRSQQIKEIAKHGMIFYTWFDEQASQMRFCLISDFHASLPFGTNLQNAPLEEILAVFLASKAYIPFEDLVFINEAPPEPVHRPPLKVFQKHIP